MKLGDSARLHGLNVLQIKASNNIIIRADMFRNQIDLGTHRETMRFSSRKISILPRNHETVPNLPPANNDDTLSPRFQLEHIDDCRENKVVRFNTRSC